MMRDVYDVAIIGMGAVGTATGFLLTEFTNVHSVLFLEKESSAGQIASDRRTNSQTRHPFGGELNYTPEVMKAIKRYSDMIPSYANSKYGRGYDILRHTKSGMVLAVGKSEKDYLRKKFHDTVKPVFPNAELMEDKEEIAKLEPYIVRGRKPDEEIGIIKLQADIVDFGELARSFEENRPDFKEFIDNLDPVLLDTVISKKAIRNIMIKNIAYSLPGGGRRLFWKYEARKIVPSIPYSDLKPAPEFGGVRTVGINKRTRELKLGEFTLPEVPEDGVNICANMAPSPGASGSLGIAHKNVAKITKALGLEFDGKSW